VYGPYTRQQADQITLDFTKRLASKIHEEYYVGPAYESGNVRPDETGWVFNVTDGKHQFTVEVYGPLIEKEDA
jgi:hypothetical protein